MLGRNYFSTSALAHSYDELGQKVDHFIEAMSKMSEREEVIKLNVPQDTAQVPNCSIFNPSNITKEIIDEITHHSKELNDEVYKFVCQLKEVQCNIDSLNINGELLDLLVKQIPKSAETYIKYVDCLVNMSSLKNLLKQNEKSTLKELNIIRYGLRDISITTKNLFIQIHRKASLFEKQVI